ncbi:MAG: radical SAM family heme chaperone HemW [Eubacterium sp.]|nr:radical SAM family heme chaperone HemW [Eubacterium sp.]
MCGLYIHIPFCVRKCNYCDFCSVGIGDGDAELTDRLVSCLIRELEQLNITRDHADRFSGFTSVFIGGGTPSILPVKQMERLLIAVNKTDFIKPEFTIECNPGTVDKEKLLLYREHGVNRISFGLQSVNEDELKSLGRIHNYADFLTGYNLARKIGFDNINIDLMSAIPGQTPESFRHTLEEVISLAPEHISVYSLIIEEGTPFYDKYHGRSPIDEDTDRQLYEMTHEMLTSAGYLHYEVSNYARLKNDENSYACKHNLNYWRRGNYIGIGPAASSHINGMRRTNTTDIDEYISRIKSGSKPYDEVEYLTSDQQLIEAIYLGLRTSEGIDFRILSDEFDFDIQRKLSPDLLDYWRREKLVNISDDKLVLTPLGFWFSDSIINQLI